MKFKEWIKTFGSSTAIILFAVIMAVGSYFFIGNAFDIVKKDVYSREDFERKVRIVDWTLDEVDSIKRKNEKLQKENDSLRMENALLKDIHRDK
jgi:hypothetical protein|nr:MAG TPA: hypothetical protein [Bacteriophage sp.]